MGLLDKATHELNEAPQAAAGGLLRRASRSLAAPEEKKN